MRRLLSFIRRQRELIWWRDPNHWYAFRMGYVAALDDVGRTGLKPKTEKTKDESARRAWRRLVTGTNQTDSADA